MSAAATRAVSGVRRHSEDGSRRNDFEVTFSAEEFGGRIMKTRRSLPERKRGRYYPTQRSTVLPSNWAPSMGYVNTPSTVNTDQRQMDSDANNRSLRVRGGGRERGQYRLGSNIEGEVSDGDNDKESEEAEEDVSDNEIIRDADNIIWIDGAPYSDVVSANSSSTRQRGEKNTSLTSLKAFI